MPDKTKKATVTKKTAPKEFKYEKLPYKDSPKLKPMEQKDITFQSPNTMQGTPFKLGSNRSNTSYSGFQAKGLISPMHTDPPSLKEQAQADANKNLKKAEYKVKLLQLVRKNLLVHQSQQLLQLVDQRLRQKRHQLLEKVSLKVL